MKRQWKRRLLAMFLSLTMMLSLVPGAFAQSDEGEDQGLRWKKVDNDAISASLRGHEEVEQPEEEPLYGAHEKVRVSIVLKDQPTLAVYSLASEANEEASAMAYRETLQMRQDAAAEVISDAIGEELDVVWNLTLAANIISANVEYGQIEAIEDVGAVDSVIVETRYEVQGKPVPYDPNMAISSDMTNTTQAWDVGYTGAGMRIAIIDTGLDIEHQSFDNDAFLHALEEDGDVDLLDEAEIAGVLDRLNAKATMPNVTAAGLHYSDKIPFRFNYVDGNLNVTHLYDTGGEHGSHVAGIAAANRYLKQGDEYVPAMKKVKMTGNAPDAQVLVMKVFGEGGGAYDSDYMVAIEDAVLLGCDTVNLSLGSGNPGMSYSTGSTTLGGQTKVYQDIMENLANTDTIVNFSAGNSGTWAEETYWGLPYSDDVVFQTDGAPGSFTNAFTVASVENNGSVSDGAIMVGDTGYSYTESSGKNNLPLSTLAGQEFDYVFVDGVGKPEDFAGLPITGKIVFCSRGDTSFYQKAQAADNAGAAAVIIYNNQPGKISMTLTGNTAAESYLGTMPAVSITQDDGAKIRAASTVVTENGKTYRTGRISIQTGLNVFPGTDTYETMSSFSSWGVPGNLMLKPEITAPGGSIWSLNGAHKATQDSPAVSTHDVYELMSGTSMASPQMAGIGALVKQYIEENNLSAKTDITDRALAMSLMMSTATPLVDEYGDYYSVFQQGAGMVNTDAAVNADSYILMGADATESYADGKVKIEMGDDPDRTGKYNFTFTINNLKDVPLTYSLDADVFTQYPISAEESGVGASFLDTSTVALEGSELLWSVKSTVSGVGGSKYDFDGNGVVDLDDGDALLDYVTGVRNSLYHQDEAYFGRNDITSYNGYLFLQKLSTNGDEVTVPANGSVTISATIQLDQAEMDELMEICPNGAYVEAYVKVNTEATEEGLLGTSHSIPFLAFYGNWTDPSMFEKGSFVEYAYGLEDRPPYLATLTAGGDIQEASLYRNALMMQYAGDSGSYYFGGNPYFEDDEYLPERNALSSTSGDRLTKWKFTAIRNAADSRLQIKNTQTNEVYIEQALGEVSSAFYYVNGGAWQQTGYNLNLNWAGTDANGNALPNDTPVEVSLTLAPELYVNADDSVNWDALGEGASQKMQFTIDNMAPVVQAVDYNAAKKELTITARDNQYIAAMHLLNGSGTTLIDGGTPNQTVRGKNVSMTLSLEGVVGKSFLVMVSDYADNATIYEFEYTIKSDLDGYYFGYNSEDNTWIAYTADGQMRGMVGSGMSGRPTRAGAYAMGYVFAVDSNCDLYAIDASDPMLLDSAERITCLDELYDEFFGMTFAGAVCDMTYSKADDTMYVVCYAGFDDNMLGKIDLATGRYTKIADKAELFAVAASEDTLYGLADMDNGNYTLVTITIDAGDNVTLTPVGEVAGVRNSWPSMTWDSTAGQLVLAGEDAIYTVDPHTAVATKVVEDTPQLVGLFTKPAEDEVQMPDAEEAVGLELSYSEITMLKNKSVRLTATVAPWNLTDKSVTWTSDDPSVADVSADGVVTAVTAGIATITATTNAAPYLSATCEVEVIAIEKDLQALVWDEEGAIWWSNFNTGDLPNYDKVIESDVKYQLATATMAGDGMIYAASMDTDNLVGTLYKVDPGDEMATEKIGALNGGFDIFTADLAYAPHLLGGCLMGLYGNTIFFIDPDTGSVLGVFNGYNKYANFVAVAYEGSELNTYYNEYMDIFLFVDADGYLYEEYFITPPGTDGVGYFNGIDEAELGSTPYDAGNLGWFNSAVYTTADDGNEYLFWSQFDGGDYVNMIAIDLYAGTIANVGSFPATVWPVGGLMDEDIPAIANPASGIDLTEARVNPESEALWSTSIEMAIVPGHGGAKRPENVGSLEFVEIPENIGVSEDIETLSMSVESNSGAVVSNDSSLVTAQVTLNKASTNGLIDVEFDTNELELIKVAGKATINSANTAEAENGKITLAYAFSEAAKKDTVVATLTFSSKTMRSTKVKLTTREDGLETPNTSVWVPVTFVVDEDPVYIPTPGGNRPGGGSSGGGTTTKPNEPTTPVEEPTNPSEPINPVVPVNPSTSQFVDVPTGAWYAEYVDYVVGHGLMNGTSETTFAPDQSLTRAMLVTILHRSAGQPSAGGSISFNDVVAGSWYEAGVNWAALNSLVNGYGDGTFNPNGNITRQELAVILWRYAQMLGISVAADGTTIPDFADRDEIAPWAAEAMSWAYRMGIITGRDSTHLAPNGGASRVEAAAMLVRFLRLVENSKNPVA